MYENSLQHLEFKVRDLLITRLPTGAGPGNVALCDCDSSCSSFTGHPIHTDFCGMPADEAVFPPLEIDRLRGAVRYASLLEGVRSFERQMKPLSVDELYTIEKSLQSALVACRAYRESLQKST